MDQPSNSEDPKQKPEQIVDGMVVEILTRYKDVPAELFIQVIAITMGIILAGEENPKVRSTVFMDFTRAIVRVTNEEIERRKQKLILPKAPKIILPGQA